MDEIALFINGRPWPAGDPPPLEATDFAEWAPVAISCEPVAGARAASLALGGEQLGPPTASPFDPTWRWSWTPRGVAGLVRGEIAVELAAGDTLRRPFALRLAPRLLDQQTWAALLADLARLGRGLAVSLGGAAFAEAILLPPAEDGRTPLEEAQALLGRHIDDLAQVVAALAANPERRLGAAEASQPLETIAAPAPDALATPPAELDIHAGPRESPELRGLRERLGGLPPTLRVRQSAASFDLPEHRWLLGLIQQVERRLRWVRRQAGDEQARLRPDSRAAQALRQIGAACERALGRARRLRGEPFLGGLRPQQTPPQSQRLARDRRYRPLRRIWRELRSTPLLALHLPMLELPIADLPALYEQWVALAVAAELLALGGQPAAQALLVERVERERWTIELAASPPLVDIELDGRRWRLRYQPRYDQRPDRLGIVALDGYLRIPDLVIELERPGAPAALVVIDAKYRRAPDGRAPQDALDDAYAYRGSLGRDGSSAVLRAVIAYPAERLAERFGAVGTLPLLPGRLEPLRGFLADLRAELAPR